MQFEDLIKTWKSSLNSPSADERRALATGLESRLRRRRWHLRLRLGWGLLMLSGSTALAAWLVLGPRELDLRESWILVPLLMLPWAAALWLVRAGLADRRLDPREPDPARPIFETLRAALAQVEAAQRRARVLGCLFALVIPLLALAMARLQATGRAEPEDLLGMAALFGFTLALTGGALAFSYFARLRPERRALEELLVDYDTN